MIKIILITWTPIKYFAPHYYTCLSSSRLKIQYSNSASIMDTQCWLPPSRKNYAFQKDISFKPVSCSSAEQTYPAPRQSRLIMFLGSRLLMLLGRADFSCSSVEQTYHAPRQSRLIMFLGRADLSCFLVNSQIPLVEMSRLFGGFFAWEMMNQNSSVHPNLLYDYINIVHAHYWINLFISL